MTALIWLRSYSYRGTLLAVSLIKLWLVAGQSRPAFANAIHDDMLFVNLAASLVGGDWLGPFDQLTLAKGPMYPLWLAFCYSLSLPSYFMQHLLYMAAVLMFLKSVSPWVRGAPSRLLIYSLMLFNPASCAFMAVHFKRETIYGSLSIMVVAGLIGLYCTTTYREIDLIKWAGVLGVSLAAFWLTREEGPWIVPPATLLLAFACYRLVRLKPANRPRIIILYLMPLAIWSTAQLAVSLINYSKYQIFATNEIKSKAFRSAFGALNRVEHERWQRYNVVPRETRLRIYEVSPSFAELKPFLEGKLGKGWARHGRFLLQGSNEGEIAGGWFMWAFRASVQAAGHYQSGESAVRFYENLADEVNRACDEGRLKAGPRRASLVPPMGSEYLKPFIEAVPLSVPIIARFKGSEPLSALRSSGPESKIAVFREISGDRVAPGKNEPPLLHSQVRQNQIKNKILRYFWLFYSRVGGALAGLALLAYAVAGVVNWRHPLRPLFVINTALLAGIAAQIVIICLIHITSFPAVNVKYLSPAVLLVSPFTALTLLDLASSLTQRLRHGGAGSDFTSRRH